MPVPTFHVNISGSIVAAYGAVVATITGAVQIINFLRDRRNIKITARHHMQIIGDPRYERKNLTVVRVANAGRRPVTITAIGAYRLHPHNAFVLADTRPALPLELTEGKYVEAIADLQGMDLSTIEHWEAYDAVGCVYRLPVAPWHTRFISRMRRRQAWRREVVKARQSSRAAPKV